MTETIEHPEGVALCYINGENIKAAFTNRVTQLLFHDLRSKGRVIAYGGVFNHEGSLIHTNRNEVTETFLISECQWMLWVDTDMVFPPDLVDRMIESAERNDTKILGGLCFSGGKSGIVKPTMYRLRSDDGTSDMGASMEHIVSWEENEVIEVDATGCACLLVHRDVVEAIRDADYGPNKWFAFTERKRLAYGEDWEFCFRAKEVGYKVMVDTAIEIGHLKQTVIDSYAFRMYKQELAHFGTESALTATHLARQHPGQLFNVKRLSRAQRRLRERQAEKQRKKQLT